MGMAAGVAAPLHEHGDEPEAFEDWPIVAIAEADELRNACGPCICSDLVTSLVVMKFGRMKKSVGATHVLVQFIGQGRHGSFAVKMLQEKKDQRRFVELLLWAGDEPKRFDHGPGKRRRECSCRLRVRGCVRKRKRLELGKVQQSSCES